MMPAASLTNRIFLASALLVAASTGLAIYRVSVSVGARAEDELHAGLAEAASLVDELSRTQFNDFAVKGSLIADLPVLKGAASTDHPPTVQPIAEDYQRRVGADMFVVVGRDGHLLARAGRLQPSPAAVAAILDACRVSPTASTYWPLAGSLVRAAAIQLVSNGIPFGTLIVGVSLDQDAARRLKALTNSDIVFAFGPNLVASTLDSADTASLEPVTALSQEFSRQLGGESYVGRVQPLPDAPAGSSPVAIVLRSRTRHLSFLPSLFWQIAIAGLAAVLVATLVGYVVARTVTRPVRALTSTMREIAATGDLGKRAPPVNPWDDEDARLLSTTFAQLTGALDRFQREAAQRERLSSLGRLSTVIAHEIRNPLMIIKSAVHRLRRHGQPDVSAAAADIDEEVQRLNHLVTEVLDFAKPVRLDPGPADLAEVARSAVQAVGLTTGFGVRTELPPAGAPGVTDAERLRAVLVNVLQNAVDAVRARDAEASDGVTLSLARLAAGRWRYEVVDAGTGIAPEDLPRLFEPFFTRRHGGSGVGLPLARNVVEGLGGTIVIDSAPGHGTTVRIDLPERSAAQEGRA
jgi:signal transduction histidine kinase